MPSARRPGRPPSTAVAARRALAAEIVRRQPTIQPAALAVELGVSPSLAQMDLAHLRRAGIGQPPVAVAADGRRLARPVVGTAPRYRIRPETLARLAEVTGRPVGPMSEVRCDRRKCLLGLLARRIQHATLARLAQITGRPVGEDVDGQIGIVLDMIEEKSR